MNLVPVYCVFYYYVVIMDAFIHCNLLLLYLTGTARSMFFASDARVGVEAQPCVGQGECYGWLFLYFSSLVEVKSGNWPV